MVGLLETVRAHGSQTHIAPNIIFLSVVDFPTSTACRKVVFPLVFLGSVAFGGNSVGPTLPLNLFDGFGTDDAHRHVQNWMQMERVVAYFVLVLIVFKPRVVDPQLARPAMILQKLQGSKLVMTSNLALIFVGEAWSRSMWIPSFPGLMFFSFWTLWGHQFRKMFSNDFRKSIVIVIADLLVGAADQVNQFAVQDNVILGRHPNNRMGPK
jgi:hypothetical protein